ncbi:YggS family pyridoxal phosphate enzyme [Bacteroidia bacterium]|nr:YggS family pyridoxal phosphate enzyme [Bacteroidia bacterium]
MSIAAQLNRLKAELPPHVKLVAVSKYCPESAIQEAYDAGQRIFGESRAQELVPKYEHLPKDIEWHFIGHLQPNKVKYIAPFIDTIHSVDSVKLLQEISEQAQKHSRRIKVLIEIHIAAEDSKYGYNPYMGRLFLEKTDLSQFANVDIIGLMGMATYTEDAGQIRNEFAELTRLFTRLKRNALKENNLFKDLSMGMSNDYKLAIEAGSTIVRIGSKIFQTTNS